MERACHTRYKKLIELTSPLDESDFESVIGYPDQGFIKLSDFLLDDIKQDAEFFSAAFGDEVDILLLTGTIYLDSFASTLDSYQNTFDSNETVVVAGKGMFRLYKNIHDFKSVSLELIPS
jgi:hypothetical protein